MLRVRRLGTVPYREGLALQHALARRASDDYVLVLGHPHVYTLGVRADRRHVLVDPATVGADLVETDRGGDVTYHGPGQLVVYPIVTLDGGPGAGPAHVHSLEQVVIDSLADLGLHAGRLAEYPGVWVDPDGPAPRKIAAIGVRTVRVPDGRRRTLHGVALNVSCDLSMYSHIVPCGIVGLGVTSLEAEGIAPGTRTVADAVVARAIEAWGSAPGQGPGRQVVDDQAVDEGYCAGLPGRRSHDGTEDATRERAPIRRLRHAGVDPESAVAIGARKPAWLRIPARFDTGYLQLGRTIHELGLVTVCEEAGCPNISECWADGTATFMVNGSRCTRACGFCLVDTRRPMPLDPTEPTRVAEAVERMRLAHAVVTCVARDDLDDGGAGGIASTIEAIRRRCPATTVEVLISDCKGDAAAQNLVFDARPDVLNHNVETVARLQRAVRPSAGYARSLTVLARAADAGLVVKSGLMVGLGERFDEVAATLADVRSVGVSIVTIGHYLRPSASHLPVARWWTPDELDALGSLGRSMGFAHVEASPLTRSSYHARGAAEAAGALQSVPVALGARAH